MREKAEKIFEFIWFANPTHWSSSTIYSRSRDLAIKKSSCVQTCTMASIYLMFATTEFVLNIWCCAWVHQSSRTSIILMKFQLWELIATWGIVSTHAYSVASSHSTTCVQAKVLTCKYILTSRDFQRKGIIYCERYLVNLSTHETFVFGFEDQTPL
jgi:hypothetical protein